MESFIINLIEQFGYLGIFLGMVLEAVIIAIPSELILATGGILASKKIFSFWLVFLTGLLGSLFCAIVIYYMGYFGGEVFVRKYGKYFMMKEEDLEKSDSWFAKYGLKASLIGRNFPIVRTLISLPIGIMRLSFPKFVLYTTIGSIPWTLAFVYFGYLLGDHWVIVCSYLDILKKPIGLGLLILIVYFLYKHIKK